MEADSLNAAILGPDAGPGTPEFDLFVREVAREMTAKAGQKCTAIRRVIAPARPCRGADRGARASASARPPSATPPTRRCAWGRSRASASATRCARGSPSSRREAEIVAGDPARPSLVSGDAERRRVPEPGAASGATARRPPRRCTTSRRSGRWRRSCPTTRLDEAAALARRGKGSLVASVFTNDGAFARDAVAALAPWHGRILIGNRVSAKSSTGHGSPLPVLVHGGPGRAGGGEELGGMRAVSTTCSAPRCRARPGC